MRNIFNSVKLTKPKKNVFDLTHDVKMSGKIGWLMPVMNLECIPGDHFDLGADAYVRFQPTITPFMHRVDVTVHYFFVPYRLVWPKVDGNGGWESFITNSEEAGPYPYINIDGNETDDEKRFLDYMGIPPTTFVPDVPSPVNALHFAAYQKIFNEYYRDQDLQEALLDTLIDGNNTVNKSVLCNIRKRNFEHDYFTSARPNAQKGAAVAIPIGEIQLSDEWDSFSGGPTPHFRMPDGTNAGVGSNLQGGEFTSGNPSIKDAGDNDPLAYDPEGTLENAPTTIQDLRRAEALQKWLERMSIAGARYFEQIFGMFGLRSPDARLQRPEYITGVKSPIIVGEVLNTTGTVDAPQGQVAGHAIGVTQRKTGSYFCQEHGVIIGLCSIMPKTAYMNGIPKQFLKNDYLDYFWPQFQHIGEQPILKQEVYAYTSQANNTFGYTPRYAEYKFVNNRVAGDLRTSPMYAWHLARIFAGDQQLNDTFITCNWEDFSRIFPVEVDTQDEIIMHILNRVRAVRPMARYGSSYLT